jgi:hypothetical protein
MPSRIDVLREISQSIQKLDDPGIDYLGQKDILSAAAPDPFAVLFVNKYILQSLEQVKIHLYARYLNEILERCRIISFADWSDLDGVSELWDHFRTKVIKPLGRRDFEFIFNIGNTASKPSYEIDEILDIISDFSIHGKVTLILTARDASKLWGLISGQKGDAATMDDDRRGQYLFNAMSIHRLLVYSPEHRITIFSKGSRQDWRDENLSLYNVNRGGREPFNVGYILGLLLRLETIHCAALGLTMSEAWLRNEVITDLKSLLAHIDDKINHLDHELVES